MKRNRSSAALIMAAIGAAVLTVTAVADVIVGSGYYSLKNTAKHTSKTLSGVDNFAMDASYALKMDGEVIESEEISKKIDVANQASETFTVRAGSGGDPREWYSYDTPGESISKHSENDSYFVYKRNPDSEYGFTVVEDIFAQEEMKDLEKIVDAVIGSMQDIIQTEDTSGGRMYIGTITDASVPPLINAGASFLLKHSILTEYSAKDYGVPRPMENVYLVDASGRATEDENGILKDVIFTVTMAGDDKYGSRHEYSAEFSMSIHSIDSTVVEPVNLDGKRVEYSESVDEFYSEKYIGTYKNALIADKPNEFVKVGERFVEITGVERNKLTGRYYEVFEPDYYPEDGVLDFDFSASIEVGNYYYSFNYVGRNGEEQVGVINRDRAGAIRVMLDAIIYEHGYSSNAQTVGGAYMEEAFTRVFD